MCCKDDVNLWMSSAVCERCMPDSLYISSGDMAPGSVSAWALRFSLVCERVICIQLVAERRNRVQKPPPLSSILVGNAEVLGSEIEVRKKLKWQMLKYTQSQKKCNFSSWIFLGSRVRVMWPWIMGNLHIDFLNNFQKKRIQKYEMVLWVSHKDRAHLKFMIS